MPRLRALEHRVLGLDAPACVARRTAAVEVRQQRQTTPSPSGARSDLACPLAQLICARASPPARAAGTRATRGGHDGGRSAPGELDSATEAEHRAEDPVLADAALAEAARFADGAGAVYAADDGEGVPEEVGEREESGPAHDVRRRASGHGE